MYQSVSIWSKISIAGVFGVFTDSTCDLPKEVMENYQIHTIPINLFANGNQYLDKITITADEFYSMLDTAKIYPTTAQPGIKDFISKYDYLASHYDQVVSIMLGKNLSGTWSNASKAAGKVLKNSNVPISVIDSKTVSVPLGLLVLRAAKAIEDGMDYETLLQNVEEWRHKTRIFVNVQTLKYFVKGGRVSAMKGFIGKVLNLKPTVTINADGRTDTFDKSFSKKGSIKKVLKIIENISKENKILSFAVAYANKEELETAQWYARKLEEIIGKEVAYIETLSPVVGVNAGIGTVGVALMLE